MVCCQATMPPVNTPAPLPPPVTHYENFPVASVLCPPHLRAPLAAIYAFARTADDLADQGTASPPPSPGPPLPPPAGRRAAPARPARAAARRPAQRLRAGRGKNPRPCGLYHPLRAAGLLPPLGQPGRPPAAAPVWSGRRAGPARERCHLHCTAAHQLLAGPERGHPTGPLLSAGR